MTVSIESPVPPRPRDRLLLARVASGVTGIPYDRDFTDTGSHNYVDLRNNPDLISELPELRDRPALRHAVQVLNDPRVCFSTVGIGEWQLPGSPGRPVQLCTYFQFRYHDSNRCASPLLLYQLLHNYSLQVHRSDPKVHAAVYGEFELQAIEDRVRSLSGWSATLWLKGLRFVTG